MSKELEALNRIFNGMSNNVGYIKYFENIRQALTPPTSDEVCEALSKLTRMSVYYNNGKFRFHGDKFGEIVDLNDLPPHLITLIGRFYEGLEEK